MISLIFALIFFILFIFFCIAGGNYLLRSIIDNVLSVDSLETFSNENFLNVKPVDHCTKIDEITENTLNFQTATNIPLSPNHYKNYIGVQYIDDNQKDINPFKNGSFCLKKSKLLYDGIWNPEIINESPYEYEKWNLTNGNLSDDYYCSDKLIEINKPMPKNYIDKSAVYQRNGNKYYTYFNDTVNDIYDTEISCFPSVFNTGITEDLKKK